MEFPGDCLIPDPVMVFDRSRVIAASPEEIWPWLVQLGKKRAGWYMTERAERLLTLPSRRAARTIEPRWQGLRVGDSIPDYGGKDEHLEAVEIERPAALVYRSERRGAVFTWALILTPLDPVRNEVHLRFRGRIKSTGWRRRLIVSLGEFFDRVTAELMLAGLSERVMSAQGLTRS